MANEILSVDTLLAKCDETIEACNLYVNMLEEEQSVIYKQLEAKNKRIVELESEVSPPIPWYYYVIGGLAGGMLGRELLK